MPSLAPCTRSPSTTSRADRRSIPCSPFPSPPRRQPPPTSRRATGGSGFGAGGGAARRGGSAAVAAARERTCGMRSPDAAPQPETARRSAPRRGRGARRGAGAGRGRRMTARPRTTKKRPRAAAGRARPPLGSSESRCRPDRGVPAARSSVLHGSSSWLRPRRYQTRARRQVGLDTSLPSDQTVSYRRTASHTVRLPVMMQTTSDRPWVVVAPSPRALLWR